jgi:hypothetical protein
MFRMFLIPAFLAALLTGLTSAPAHAYGAAHVGYTTVSPSGNVQHYGATAASGPGGSYAHTSSTTATAGGTVAHTSSTAATGAYGGTYQGSSARVYAPTTYQGYSAAGHSGTVSTTGVVRYP